MLSAMSANGPESSNSVENPIFNNVAENLYRHNKSGRYYALFKRGGKQIRKSLKTNDKDLAKRKLTDLRANVANLTTDGGTRNITFTDLSERWLEKQKPTLKESSYRRIKNCIDGLAPFFKGITFKNITLSHCEKWASKRGGTISASSYKQERRALVAMFTYAIRLGVVLNNIASALDQRKVESKQVEIPTQEQFEKLIKTMRKADPRGEPGCNLVELLAYSGMRLNEGVNLLWGDVDFDRGCFKVTGGEKGTKNHEERTVPLFPAMRELLERIKGASTPASREEIIPINDAKTMIRRACEKSELPYFTHHNMRHYFCSNAIEAGVNFKVIAGWLGHSDGGVLVAKTYGHLRDTHSYDMAKRMVFSAVSDEKPENVIHAEEVGA